MVMWHHINSQANWGLAYVSVSLTLSRHRGNSAAPFSSGVFSIVFLLLNSVTLLCFFLLCQQGLKSFLTAYSKLTIVTLHCLQQTQNMVSSSMPRFSCAVIPMLSPYCTFPSCFHVFLCEELFCS